MKIRHALAAIIGLLAVESISLGQATRFTFDFGSEAIAPGYTQIKPDTVYTPERGFGFEPRGPIVGIDSGGADPLTRDGITGEGPISFSMRVPEGNYRVTVTLGDAKAESITTVRAETRRLLLEKIRTAAGSFEKRTFTVNVRGPMIGNTGERMMFSLREWPEYWTWDNKLTVSISGTHPTLCAMEVEKVDDAITIFLMGDSTVTDQMQGVYGTWGMFLPRWFDDKVAIANHAESGETVKGFRYEKRWDKVLNAAKPGDYIFMQFGHNDKNAPRGTDAMWPPDSWSGQWANKVSPADTDYKEGLKQFITEAKAKGVIPVVVTPMTAVTTAGGPAFGRGARGGTTAPATAPVAATSIPNNQLEPYARNAILAAKEAGAATIDLFAMSTDMHIALGPENSRKAVNDGLHSNLYGGYLLSRCVVEGIKLNLPDLAKHLLVDAGSFDPKNPAPQPNQFDLPVEPGQPGIPSFGGGARRGRGPASGPATAPVN